MGTIQEEITKILAYNIEWWVKAKEHILRKICYNEDGFGSVNETYKEAKKQLNSTTIADTK